MLMWIWIEKRELLHIVSKSKNQSNHTGLNMEVYRLPRTRTIIWPRHTTQRHIPKGLYIPLQRHLYIHIYCFFIHNSWEMESPWLSINWWSDNENYLIWVHIHNDNLFCYIICNFEIFRKWIKLENIQSEWLRPRSQMSPLVSHTWIITFAI